MYDQKTCPQCSRHVASVPNPILKRDVHGSLVKTYALHRGYGCDTGCCGHVAYAEDVAGNTCSAQFEFTHPYGAPIEEWAQEFCADAFRNVPFSWADCRISDD